MIFTSIIKYYIMSIIKDYLYYKFCKKHDILSFLSYHVISSSPVVMQNFLQMMHH